MRIILLAVAATLVMAQRQIPSQSAAPGSTQDFSRARVTRPMVSGTTLPSTCRVGDQFFKSDATAGQNLYACTSTNTWTQQSGSDSGGGFLTAKGSVSGTVNYDASSCGGGMICTFTETLTGNITAGTLTLPSSGTGQMVQFLSTQDGTGGRTKACPTNFTGCPSPTLPDTAANAVSLIIGTYDGTSVVFQSSQVVSSPSQGCVKVGEASANGSNYSLLCAPASLSANRGLVFPDAAPTTGYYLTVGSSSTAPDGTTVYPLAYTAAAAGCDPIAAVCEFEDFINNSTFNAPPWGKLQWAVNAASGACSDDQIAAEASHPGIVRFSTDTTNGAVCWFYPKSGNYTAGMVLPADNFTIYMILRIPGTDSNFEFNAGLTLDAPTVTTMANGLYFQKSNAGTDWAGVCNTSSTPTTTTVTSAAGTGWIVLRIRRVDASTIGFTSATTYSGISGATERTCTTNIPTGTLYPFFMGKNGSGASRNMDFDFWSFSDSSASSR